MYHQEACGRCGTPVVDHRIGGRPDLVVPDVPAGVSGPFGRLRAWTSSDLPTPALVVDLDAFDDNVATMADRWPGDTLRPHVKAFKSTALAQRIAERRPPRLLLRHGPGGRGHGAPPGWATTSCSPTRSSTSAGCGRWLARRRPGDGRRRLGRDDRGRRHGRRCARC